MAKILDQPRYKCALAAMQTVQAIPGAIPILHSGPGCASKLNDNNGTSGRYSPNIFPCTSISEKEVVFGGSNKLRSTIENALKDEYASTTYDIQWNLQEMSLYISSKYGIECNLLWFQKNKE